MTAHAKRIFLSAIGLALILAGTVAATVHVKRYTYRPYLYDNLYLPSGKFLKQISLGYNQIAADIIWSQAVQYYGGYRKGDHDLAYFEGLIQLVSDLDPHFVFPYRFGALVLSQDMEAFDRGIAVLRKGMQHNPTDWELSFELGFLYFVDAHDPDMAARYFDLASRMPDAPDLARRFAAFVYSRAGHHEMSVRMWQELKENSDDPYMRELAEHYLEKLKRRGAVESRTSSERL